MEAIIKRDQQQRLDYNTVARKRITD